MTSSDALSRRAMLAAPALLAMAAAPEARAEPGRPLRPTGSRTLVAYLSRSGNTRVIAGTLQRALRADLFEIRPAQAYPEDYEETVERARGERDRGDEPPLVEQVPGMAAYDTVFLGFPIWGETAPPPVRSFLSTHDLSDKTLRPFITHGGYGLGSSLAVLASHAPGARIDPPLVMEADQERRTLNRVRDWLAESASP